MVPLFSSCRSSYLLLRSCDFKTHAVRKVLDHYLGEHGTELRLRMPYGYVTLHWTLSWLWVARKLFPLCSWSRLSLEECDASWRPPSLYSGQISFLWCRDIWQILQLEQVLLNPHYSVSGCSYLISLWASRTCGSDPKNSTCENWMRLGFQSGSNTVHWAAHLACNASESRVTSEICLQHSYKLLCFYWADPLSLNEVMILS
jgi:hypothetical protein